MASRLLRRGRNALILTACALGSAGACTFPSVDYDDGPAGCSAPSTCAADAQKCGDEAHKLFDACSQPCLMKPGCQAMCDSDLSVKLGQCNETCKSCAAGQGCANATSSCKANVGG